VARLIAWANDARARLPAVWVPGSGTDGWRVSEAYIPRAHSLPGLALLDLPVFTQQPCLGRARMGHGLEHRDPSRFHGVDRSNAFLPVS
jgi:hypothetical protein